MTIEYRWADYRSERLPALAADLLRSKVTVIAALGGPAPAVAAKAATSSVPIVFGIPDDPVKLGLVSSLARPGGNLTGVYFLTGDLMSKRFDLMRMLVPGVSRVAVLLNPDNAARAEAQISEVQAIARTMGLRIQIMKEIGRAHV